MAAELTKSLAKKFKPKVSVEIDVNTHRSYGPEKDTPSNWRKEEAERLEAECVALQKELDEFDPEKVAKKVKHSLEIQLKLKKLRIEECKLRGDCGPNTAHY